jgi:hypothetical protein
MSFLHGIEIERSWSDREIRAGIPAVAAMLVVEAVAVRWLLTTARGPVTIGWMSVAVAAWTLGIGILGWLMATRRDAGLVFLWAMFLAGTVSLAGGIASSGGAEWVGRVGYAALAFLSAVTIHFHVIFPRRMRPPWRRAALAAAYGFATLLASVWVFYPAPFSNNLRLLSRAFFGLSGLLAWVRMFYVGRFGYGLEEKWVGRWLSMVLFVGGIVPAWGYLMPQVVLGQPVISLRAAFLFEMAIPLGYFVMVERYEPWREGKPVPRIISGVVVAMAEAFALAWAWGYLVAARRGTWLMIVTAAAMVALFFPLYRITWTLVENDLYGGWYNREMFLKKFSAALEGAEGKELWRRAVRALAEGMKIEQVCGRTAAGDCFCWHVKHGETEGECLEGPVLEAPVRSGGELLGALLLTRHIEGSGLGRKDRLAIETAAAMVGMKLEAARMRAELRKLQAEMGMPSGAGAPMRPNPLSEREVQVLELAA